MGCRRSESRHRASIGFQPQHPFLAGWDRGLLEWARQRNPTELILRRVDPEIGERYRTRQNRGAARGWREQLTARIVMDAGDGELPGCGSSVP